MSGITIIAVAAVGVPLLIRLLLDIQKKVETHVGRGVASSKRHA